MLWNWTGKDKFGKSRNYQTDGPDCSELSMMTHLREHYRNLEITNLARGAMFLPATGIAERHIFSYGILDAVEKELGIGTNQRIILKRAEADRLQMRDKPLESLLAGARSVLKRPSIIRV